MTKPSHRIRFVCAAAICLCLVGIGGTWTVTKVNLNLAYTPGDVVDQLNGVPVYYNGAINHVRDRNQTADGYNVGLRWQCVEFVKRYYLERFGHRMPDSRGNAKDFFDARLADKGLNSSRNLVQYRNMGSEIPAPDDIIVFAPWLFNPYGHVAIVTQVDGDHIEIIQQNPGPFGTPRERLPMVSADGQVKVGTGRVLGWLRRP